MAAAEAFDPGTVVPAPLRAAAWTLGLHDRSLAAWVIVIAYVIAIGCCVRAWLRERSEVAHVAASWRREYAPQFWLVIAAVLVLLAVNKPLDLHNLITDYGRTLARAGGWYQKRRSVQVGFAAVVGAASFLALLFLGLRLRKRVGAYALALLGLWLLAIYVGLRIASFHHVDRWFGADLRGVKRHWVIELLAIGTIIAGAIFPFRKRATALTPTTPMEQP